MRQAGVLILLIPLIPACVLIAVAIGSNAVRKRRRLWLADRLHRLSQTFDGDSSAPDDWPRITETLGALAVDPDALDRMLSPLAETARQLLGNWAGHGLEQLMVDVAPASGRRRHRLRGRLALLRAAQDPPGILFLTTCLLEGDGQTAGAAALVIGDRPVPYAGAAIPLATALLQASSRAAPAIAWALQRVLHAHPELIAMAGDFPAPEVRRTALRAAASVLAEDGMSSLRGLIEGSVEDPDPGVRVLAHDALCYLRPAVRLELATAGLDDPAPEVVRAAARVLAAAGDGGAVAALIGGLGSAGPKLQREVLDLLAANPTPAAGASRGLLRGGGSSAWTLEVLAAAGALDAGELSAFLEHRDFAARSAAARGLLRLPAPVLREQLPRILAVWRRERNSQALLALAACLAATGDPEAGLAVVERLPELSESVAERLREILGRWELLAEFDRRAAGRRQATAEAGAR